MGERWEIYGLVIRDDSIKLAKQVTGNVEWTVWDGTKEGLAQVSRIEQVIKEEMRA